VPDVLYWDRAEQANAGIHGGMTGLNGAVLT
jgi:hypothetical protein